MLIFYGNLLLSAGSTREDPSLQNWKIVDWDIKNQIKQNNFLKTSSLNFPHVDGASFSKGAHWSSQEGRVISIYKAF